jgi:hypothetical protein
MLAFGGTVGASVTTRVTPMDNGWDRRRMSEGTVSSISSADTLEKMGEFWDTHDLTDFDTDAPDVEFEISCAVPIEANILQCIMRNGVDLGGKCGVS